MGRSIDDFQRGLRQTAAIYQAGIRGASVPFFTGMRVKDVTDIYTYGVIAALEEVEEAWNESHPEAALREANEATYLASKAKR